MVVEGEGEEKGRGRGEGGGSGRKRGKGRVWKEEMEEVNTQLLATRQ